MSKRSDYYKFSKRMRKRDRKMYREGGVLSGDWGTKKSKDKKKYKSIWDW